MLLSIVLTLSSPFATVPPSNSAALLQDGAANGERLRRWRERRGETGQGGRIDRQGRTGGDRQGSVAVDQRLSYGDDARQRVLVWRAPAGQARPPLAVFVHGGGWQNGAPEMVSEKPAWFRQHGWAFASIGYRLLPDAPVEQQAADVGAALRHLRSQAARLGYDPDRILLLGHSAGAHLAALVSTDPQYAGDAFGAIRGVIPIDGAGYDVVAQLADGGRFMTQRTYIPAFGTDPARQRALSPTTHAGGRDAPDWLLLYTSARDDAENQSRGLAAALGRGGARTQLVEVPARSRNPLAAHREINVDFGTPAYAANDAVLALMRRVAGQ
jgi:acetyl esterase/lipase